jgi:hypothetical protein
MIKLNGIGMSYPVEQSRISMVDRFLPQWTEGNTDEQPKTLIM